MSQAPAIHTFTDAQELTRAAAGLFLEVGKQAIAERNRFLVALSGGSTPKALYSILANDKYAQQLDWSKVHFLFGDERSVPPTHADSNFAMANAILFSPLHLPSAQTPQYETTLRHLTTAVPGQWPRLDLVLLGMGDDGHTASLFPGTASLTEQTRWVVPSTSPQGTRARVTLTLGVINHASVVLFLVAGRNKAAVVRRVLEQRPGDPGPYPAALIRPETGRLLWYLDRAAASELTATTDD